MRTLRIINNFNFTSDEFIKIITSNDYYNFLKNNDVQLLDFKFESFDSNDNEINYKVNFKYKSIIPEYVSKFLLSDFNENVSEIINFNIKKKFAKLK